MYMRDTTGKSLSQVADELNADYRVWNGVGSELVPHVEDGDNPTLSLGNRIEIPAGAETIKALAPWVGVPAKSLIGLDPDVRQMLLNEQLRRQSANLTIHYDAHGIREAFKPSDMRIEPRAVAEAAMHVMDPGSPVIDFLNTQDELQLDVTVPSEADYGIGGDVQTNAQGLRVGDITRGGLRFLLDRKNNRAPGVQPYLYRLVCTNGMEVPDSSLRLDARGNTVDAVLAELETMAQRAMGQVEDKIRAFYELREERVEGDVTQRVIQVARERGLPDRTAHRLATRVPEITDDDGRATMFDVVNLITNAANAPELATSAARRRTLEMAGGVLVDEHHARCSHCQRSLN